MSGSLKRFMRSLDREYFDPGEWESLRELRRTNDLLSGIAGAVGADVTDADAEAFEAVPREVVRIPQDRAELPLPSGETAFRFRTGAITPKDFPGIDVGSVTSLRTLTEQNPVRIDAFRSVSLTADDEVLVSVEDAESVRIAPGEVVTVTAPAIREMSLYANRACNVSGFASTRPQVDVSLSPSDLRRVGYILRTGSVERIRWGPGPFANQALNAGIVPSEWGAPEVLTGGMEDITLSVQTGAGSPGAADVTVYGANSGDEGTTPTWREIASVTGLSPGDHHLFTIEQEWRRLKVEGASNSGSDYSLTAEIGGRA